MSPGIWTSGSESTNPSLHSQKKDPFVLWHRAFLWQLCVPATRPFHVSLLQSAAPTQVPIGRHSCTSGLHRDHFGTRRHHSTQCQSRNSPCCMNRRTIREWSHIQKAHNFRRSLARGVPRMQRDILLPESNSHSRWHPHGNCASCPNIPVAMM